MAQTEQDRQDWWTIFWFNTVFLSVLTAIGLGGLYVLVRFVKWAWSN